MSHIKGVSQIVLKQLVVFKFRSVADRSSALIE